MEEGQDQLFQAEDGTALRFFTQAVKNNFVSEQQGRPVFDTVLYVDVIVPASRESTPQFELERVYSEEAGLDANGQRKVVRSAKYDEYRKAIDAFKSQNDAGVMKGTPLSQWPNVDAGTAATLRAVGVFTVEQLAEVSDGNLPKIGMGGRVLREQAKQFLQSRTFGIPTAQAAAETAHLKEENARLQNLVNDQSAQIAALSAQLQATAPQADTTATAPSADPLTNAAPANPFTPPSGLPDPNNNMFTQQATPPPPPPPGVV